MSGPPYDCGPFGLIYLQLRAGWQDTVQQCVVLNSDSSKLNIIVFVITDIILLIMVLVGLFRLCRDGGGKIGIGLLLWRQVGWRPLPSTVIHSAH